MNLTSPVTYCWVDVTNAWIASRSGVNHFPSYTTWAIWLPSFFLASIVSRSRINSSNWSWAAIKIVPPGVSYTPRDFIPTTRFSTISTIPIPFSPPRRFNSVMISETFISFPFNVLGTPASNVIVTSVSLSGAFSGATPKTSMLS